MEILVQSILRATNPTSLAFHLRYWDRRTCLETWNLLHPEESPLATETGVNGRKPSLIILRKEYAYLEPIIRETFQDAHDVRVLVDRRCMGRRKSSGGQVVDDRRTGNDRRVSCPMLDIHIRIDPLAP